MDERVLKTCAAPRRRGERGFTMVEVLTAAMIGVVALIANMTMFATAEKDFAFARQVTDATNLATNQFAAFKTMTLAEIQATTAAPTVAEKAADLAANPRLGLASPLLVGWHEERRGLAAAAGKAGCPTIGDRPYCRSWTVSYVDVDANGTADMAGSIVRVKLTVDWWVGAKKHTVTLSTMTTGRPL